MGKNLYFLDNRVHKWVKDFPHQENEEWEKFAKLSFNNTTKNDEKAESNNSSKKAIAMKNIQIPIMLGTNLLNNKKDVVKSAKSIIFKQEMKRLFFSPSQGKKRYMYILGNFNFLGYKPYSLSVLIDTGATICSCIWNVLPSKKWMLMKSPIFVKGIETKIEYKAKKCSNLDEQ